MLLFSALLTGCAGIAQLQGWEPCIDHKSEHGLSALRQDIDECQLVAAAYTGIGVGEIFAGIGAGAVIGGAVGLGIASVPVGAAGAVVGSATGTLTSGKEYKQVFSNCLRGRGHNPLN